jgi:hypothetical protein
MFYLYSRQKEYPGLGQATCPSEVPKDLHYAIIIFDKESVYIPGDERSITNPGHGYPARTESYTTHQYFFTKDLTELNKFVKHLYEDKDYKNKFIFFQVNSLGKVNVDVSIALNMQGTK